ncbi:hypothetical protein [Teredinibacter turnerae]|uniref:hypothetical protein n=1 Tax=Teredinibacter turnerae TaxID=2426 RepID=UPI0004103A4B|nr:hypothetical protein [Teredinibacter turnerae]
MEAAMVATIRQALAIVLSAISMTVSASQECLVLSNGSKISIVHYREGVLQIDAALLKESKVLNPVWPSYSEFMGSLVFEARENGRSGIYKANATTSFQSSELLMFGRYPALSPGGDKIAYFDEHNNLSIKDVRSGTDTLIAESYKTLSVWKRPLWISNNELIYIAKNEEVFLFNRSEDTHSKLISEKLFPVASSDGVVLFIDHDARTLFEYKADGLRVVFKNRFLSIGSGLVMLRDGFLYSRQTWPEVLRLSEEKTTFYFARDSRSEKELVSNLTLFGGSLLPCALGSK